MIRLSGPAAEATGRAVVHCPGRQEWGSHRVLYGHVLDAAGEQRLDEVLLLLMQAPRSFTGEDVVELHCHGGVIAVQRVLERVLAEPGVRAGPAGGIQPAGGPQRPLGSHPGGGGERAGGGPQPPGGRPGPGRIGWGYPGPDHRSAGAVARSADRAGGPRGFRGGSAAVGSPDPAQALQTVRDELLELVADGERGDALRHGLRVALVGRPNVGKSSLLNRLSRRERAIVTDLPGTTRDLLESEIVLEGVPITLLDTAGIRSTDDAVEQLGIARSEEALRSADVVVLVADGHVGWTAEDQALLERIPDGVPRLLVANKSDLPAGGPPMAADVRLSALEGEGEEALVQALLQRCGAGEAAGVLLALNQRQRDLASVAAAALARSREVAAQQLPWDFWTIDLREAIRALGEITGEELTEAVLDRVFSRFCIGK